MAQGADNTNAQLESSIAKAREAQKKFEETKAKAEAAIKQAEDAAKKAKAIQQQIKDLQALSETPGGLGAGVKGGIAAIVGSQIGTLKGKLTAQILKQVMAILNKFSSGCPNSKELERIIKTRSTLLKHISSFEKRVNKFSSIASTLTTTVTLVSVAIKIITSIPIPTSVPPGAGIPVNILTKFSNALVKLNKTVDKLSGDAVAITALISSIGPLLTSLKNRLNSIDLAIQQCSLGQPADLGQILATAQPPENTGSEGTPNADYEYQGYTLEIVQDPNSPKIAPRRFAIAKDKSGIVRFRGDSSFSSSTQVLLDELKFEIDNQFT
jgi:hypothetical protein